MSERDHTPDHGPDPELLLRHGASVRALAGAILGDSHAADDVAQEAYLAALRGGTVPVRDTGKWLRGVTRNLARKWIRTESRRRRREDAQPEAVAPASPEETAERLETESALTEAVRALAEPYRTVVVLRYFDGLTTKETAARTGAPEATVKTRLRRGLAMLRDGLDHRYGRRSAWAPLLIRIARPGDPAAAAAAAGTVTLVAGGIIMAKKLLIVAVLAAVLAAVYISVTVLDLTGPGSGPAGDSGEPPVVAEGVNPEDGADSGTGTTGSAGTGIPDAEAFRVVVRHFDGSPAAGAKVRLVDLEEKSRGSAVADDDGTAILKATGGAVVVHASAAGASPETREVTATAGAQIVIDLAEGSIVSGTLLFGETPAAGVEIKLHSQDPGVASLAVVTDARGAFRFSGLPTGARVYLFAGWDVYFVDPAGQNNVDVTAPATDLALRAARHPAIRGLVVDADGKPIEGAKVDCKYQVKSEGGGSHRVSTGPDGRFEARPSVGTKLIESVRIEVTTPDESGREVVEISPSPPKSGDIDVGRIVVRDPRIFDFVVTGPEGRPVTGATVLPADDLSRVTAPTNAEGKTGLAVAGGTTTVLVGAMGFGNVEVRLPDEPAGPIPVRLPGGTRLTVNLKKRDGSLPMYLDLELRADARLIDGPEEFVWELYPPTGAAKPTQTHQTDETTELRYNVPSIGVVRLGGILPGVPFRIVILDRVTGDELETRELTLNPREHRNVDIVLTMVEHTLSVVVRDGENKPIAGARVVARAGRRGISARTTAAGRVVIPGVRGEDVRVEVREHGYAPFVATYPLATLPDEVPVVLQAGRSVRLTVVDPAGKPVAAEWTEARVPELDWEFQGMEVTEGIFDFRDLPATAARLLVTYAGKVHEVKVGAADATARIEMPATGSVIVRFEGKLDEPIWHRIRLVPTGDGTEVTGDVGYIPDRDKWEIRIPAVMPGAYRIVLEHMVDSDEGEEDAYEVCRKGGPVTVAAGREAEGKLP